jgi:hypothetical protein
MVSREMNQSRIMIQRWTRSSGWRDDWRRSTTANLSTAAVTIVFTVFRWCLSTRGSQMSTHVAALGARLIAERPDCPPKGIWRRWGANHNPPRGMAILGDPKQVPLQHAADIVSVSHRALVSMRKHVIAYFMELMRT